MSTNESEPTTFLSLADAFSHERLLPYLSFCEFDQPKALLLYQWNIKVSSAFFELLGVAEVALRNALNDELAKLNPDQTTHWFENFNNILSIRAQQDISKAKYRATLSNRSETVGRVVAELNFGFWRYLLAGRYEATLWTPALKNGFPNLDRLDRKIVYQAITRLHILRNRIAHLEPIFLRELNKDAELIYQVISWISFDVAIWAEEFSRISACLSQKTF